MTTQICKVENDNQTRFMSSKHGHIISSLKIEVEFEDELMCLQ